MKLLTDHNTFATFGTPIPADLRRPYWASQPWTPSPARPPDFSRKEDFPSNLAPSLRARPVLESSCRFRLISYWNQVSTPGSFQDWDMLGDTLEIVLDKVRPPPPRHERRHLQRHRPGPGNRRGPTHHRRRPSLASGIPLRLWRRDSPRRLPRPGRERMNAQLL